MMLPPPSSSSSSSSKPSDAVGDGRLTRLDRSLNVILTNPDQTPSRQAGITPQLERLHRFHGTSIIFEASRGLTLGPSTFATACTIFHRFFHSASLKDYDVWSVALASTLLATKVEEEVRSLKQIIEEYTNVYARRLVLADLSIIENETETTDDKAKHDRPFTTETVLSSEHVACLREPIARWATSEQRRTICADRLPQQLNKLGPVYKEWYDQITKMESILLRQLGFIFYWIADSHPHKFILDFCRVLELDNKPFIQRVWDYCNDSFFLDLSVRYLPEIIASSAIFLAARDFDIALPMKPHPWWEVFLGNATNQGNDLVDVANAILGISNSRLGTREDRKGKKPKGCDSDMYADWLGASYGFIPPYITHSKNDEEGSCAEKSFNGPDSFLWFYYKDLFDKEIQNESSST